MIGLDLLTGIARSVPARTRRYGLATAVIIRYHVLHATFPASSFRSTRRNMDRDGGISRPFRSRHAPSAASASGGMSAVHSAIAVTESAPASTAVTVNANTTAAWWRMPHRCRGSGPSARHSSRLR